MVNYVTRQRQVLTDVFEAAKRPMTPSELCEAARKELPSVGIATVYRAIRQFVSEGRVRVVEVPGAAPHYERATKNHRHFFLCHQCRRLFDLMGCMGGLSSLAPRGFRVRRHEIVLYGECAACVRKAN